MPDRPNVLFIHTEHHRGDCLGIEDHPCLLTPTMDNIGLQGARCTRFYSACPSCVATRRTILSGLEPQTHGLVGYRDCVDWDAPATMPECFRQAGYQTVHFGRDMHQWPRRKGYGFEWMEIQEDYHEWLRERSPQHGRDEWFAGGVMHNDWTVHPWQYAEDLHETNWTVDRALRFLTRRDPSRPWFMSLGFVAAHPPFQPPNFYFERYLRTGVPAPHLGDWAAPPSQAKLDQGDYVAASHLALSGEAMLSLRAAYYGLLNHVDDQLRRLLNPITALKSRHDTIIVLTADHGEMLGDHYRHRKSLAYEGSARVPFLISAPARYGIDKGRIVDALATHADIMPTLLDLAELPIPDSIDGLSLCPYLRGETPERWREELHIEHSPYHQCLTDGCWKYIWWPGDGREHLFDLVTDPNELHDLADEQPERTASWRVRLIERLRERPEGFVQDGRLVAGRPYGAVIPR